MFSLNNYKYKLSETEVEESKLRSGPCLGQVNPSPALPKCFDVPQLTVGKDEHEELIKIHNKLKTEGLVPINHNLRMNSDINSKFLSNVLSGGYSNNTKQFLIDCNLEQQMYDEFVESRMNPDEALEASHTNLWYTYDDSFSDYESQGFGSAFVKIFYPNMVDEIDLVENMASVYANIKAMIQSWFKVIKKWVVATYKTITETLQQWAITIKVAVESLLHSALNGDFGIMKLFALFKSAGVPSTPEQDKLTHELLLQGSKSDIIPENTKEFQAQGLDVFKKVLECSPLPIMTAIATSLIWLGSEQFGCTADASSNFYKTISAFATLKRIDPSDLMKKFVNCIYRAFTGNDFWIEFQLDTEFNSLVNEIIGDMAQLDTLVNPPLELQKKITSAFNRMEVIYPALLLEGDTKYANTTSKIFMHIRDKVSPWSANVAGLRRMKPVVVCLGGASATGKTYTQKGLIEHVPMVLHKVLSPFTYREDLAIYASHARMPSSHAVNCMGKKNEFDDGYNNPFFYTFEEMYTSKLMEVKTDWSNHFIKCCDDQTYGLNMAFQDKGKKFFNSPFVVATGNYNKHHIMMEDPLAYHRRIEFDLRVTRGNVPPNQHYDPRKHAVFTPTQDMLSVLRSDKTPSKVLTKMITNIYTKTGKVSFSYTTLVFLMALVYFERLALYALEAHPKPLEALNRIHQWMGYDLDAHDIKVPVGTNVFWDVERRSLADKGDACIISFLGDCADKVNEITEQQKQAMKGVVEAFTKTYDAFWKAVDDSMTAEQKGKAIIHHPYCGVCHMPRFMTGACRCINKEEIDKETKLTAEVISIFEYPSTLQDEAAKLEERAQTAADIVAIQRFKLRVAEEERKRYLLEKPIDTVTHEELVEIYSIGASKDSLVFDSDEEVEDLPLNDATYQSQSGKGGYFRIPAEGLTHIQNSKRADYIFEMSMILITLTNPQYGKGLCMSSTRGGLLALLQYNNLSTLCTLINWKPEDRHTVCIGNPFLHFSHFDLASMGARKRIRSYGCVHRQQLSASQWSEFKKMFGEMYYHWYLCYRSIVDNPKLKGRDAELLDNTWRLAIPHFTKAQFNDFSKEFHLNHGKQVTGRGNVVPYTNQEVKDYKQRQADNMKRNNTQPKRTGPRVIYQSEAQVKRADNKKNKKGAERRNEAREYKSSYQSQGAKDSLKTLVDEKYKDQLKVSSVFIDNTYTMARKIVADMGTMTRVSFAWMSDSIVRSTEILDVRLMAICIVKTTTEKRARSAFTHYMLASHRVHKLNIDKFKEILYMRLATDTVNDSNIDGFIYCVASTAVTDVKCDADVVNVVDILVNGLARREEYKDYDPIIFSHIMRQAYSIFELGTGVTMPVEVKNYYSFEDGVHWFDILTGVALAVSMAACVGSMAYLIYTIVKKFHLVEDVATVDSQLLEEIHEVMVKAEENGVTLSITHCQTGDLPNKDQPDNVNIDRIMERRNQRYSSTESQMGTNSTAIAITVSSKYAITVGGFLVGNLTFVEGGTALLNAHVWETLPETFNLYPFVPVNRITNYRVEKSSCTIFFERITNDKILVNIPKVRAHPSIIKHFIKQAELPSVEFCHSGVISNFVGLDKAVKSEDVVSEIRRIQGRSKFINASRPYELDDYFLYKWSGAVRGSCGSTLFAEVGHVVKIIGEHTAGKVDTHTGVAVVVTYEELFPFSLSNNTSTRSPLLNKTNNFSTIPLSLEGEAYKIGLPGDMDFTGVEMQCVEITTPVMTSATDSTVFIPTVFEEYGFKGGSPKIPANLGYEAYQNALKKENDIDPTNYAVIADEYVEEYKACIFNKLYGGVSITGCRMLTAEEALGNYKDLNPFDKSTAKGVRLKHWKMSKRSILERGEDYEPFLARHKARLDKMRNGEYEHQINVDKLKDEPRDPERVALKKTRVFKITDFTDNLIIKQGIGDLYQKTKDLHWLCPAACGVDPGGSEWRIIANYFVGYDVLASDIKGFESTVSAFVYSFLWFVFSIAYPDPFDRRVACYSILMIINAIRFDRGIGFILGRQNTSGNWATTWLNTMSNMLYFCVVVIHGAKMHNEDPREALRDLRIKLYSDDNLVALRREWFTPAFVVSCFKNIFGVEVTSVDKGNVIGMTSIWEASFLSRGFRLEKGQVFCPLAYESLITQIYYVRVPKKHRADDDFKTKQLQQNLDNVARELREYEPRQAAAIAYEISNFLATHKTRLRFDFEPDSYALVKLRLQ